jgi:uncharacterized membrane protein YoaK (UPF0700 family)
MVSARGAWCRFASGIWEPALLATSAGFADAIGYMNGGTFAANMTGNTVLLGLALAAAQPSVAAYRCAILCAFFLGALAGRLLFLAARRRAAIPLTVAASILIVLGYIEIGPASSTLGIAVAMGIQATSVTRFRGMAISTVVITSAIARLAETALERLHPAREGAAPAATAPDVLAATWLCYGIGALMAGMLISHMAMPLIVPGGILASVAVLTARREGLW